jgi:hypothetical protein
MQLDPTRLIDNREEPMTRTQQEYLVLYVIIVAGKHSEFANAALTRFATMIGDAEFPLEVIHNINDNQLVDILRKARTGNYEMKFKAFKYAGTFWNRNDLKKVTPDEWANVGGDRIGIGPKSSRYICMCLDPENANYAALDTHVLKWLRHLGFDAPKSTPPAGPWYTMWELVYLQLANQRGRIPAELDLDIWMAYKYGKEIPA